MELVIGGIVALALIIGFIILLAVEQHDKENRQKQGLPPKKYHDITDYDVTTVYTIEHCKKQQQ